MTTERPHRVMAMSTPEGIQHECLDCGQTTTGDAPPLPCPGPTPGAPVGDHPMESTPRSFLLDDTRHFSGGVVVMASLVYSHDGTQAYPSLVFRFTTVDGEFMPPIVLVCNDPNLRKLIPLITRGVEMACDAAAKATEGGGGS